MPSQIDDVADALIASYEGRGAANTRGVDLPSRAAVVALFEQVEELLFPGFSAEVVDESRLAYATRHHLALLAVEVREQTFKDLCFTARAPDLDMGACGPGSTVDARAEETTRAFLEFLPALREQLLLDVEALHAGDPAAQSREEVILAYPGLRAILAHRVGHFFWGRGVRLIARILSEHLHSLTGIDIHPGATIGRSFHIDHGTGVVIGETTVIGDHVKLYQGVSLGALSVSRRKYGEKRHPTIEDHVTIYAGATILGGDTTVGHHSVVGGNVWLIKSVPPYSVVENDPRIQVRNKADPPGDEPAWYYEI